MSTSTVISSDSAPSEKKANEMIVAITGATGLLGTRLVKRLHADNHQVRILTRSRSKALSIFPVVDYPGIQVAEESEWENCIQGSTAVVNLAGFPVTARWSPEVKKEIMDSRVKATTKVVDAINNSTDELRPKVLVTANAVGYYGTSETDVYDEKCPSGTGYLAEVGIEWEAAARRVNKDVRLAVIRVGIILAKEGGALANMIPSFKMFAGGPLGSGKQWISWVHVDDLVNLFYEAICNPSYEGVFNGTAPNPVRMSELCSSLGSVLGRPSWLHVPEFVVKLALKEGASVLLKGQKVLPKRATELGFTFNYPDVKDAVTAVVSS